MAIAAHDSRQPSPTMLRDQPSDEVRLGRGPRPINDSRHQRDHGLTRRGGRPCDLESPHLRSLVIGRPREASVEPAGGNARKDDV